MIISLAGFGISSGALNIIQGHTRTLRSGPYLDIMVPAVICEDVDDALLAQGQPVNTWSVARPVHDLEYADDTLLLALTTTQLQRILTALESQAKKYGMQLNLTKTEILVDPGRAAPSRILADGSPVTNTTRVKYLGCMISWTKTFDAAFKYRAALTESGYKKPRLVWSRNLPRNTKLRIFQSTFIPLLIYGLDTLPLTDRQIHIDAYYLKCFRRIS